MSRHYDQFVNQSAPRASASMRDIDPLNPAGTVNDMVLRFNPANDLVVGEGLAIVHSATLGDSIQVTFGGVYEAVFRFSLGADEQVLLGVSQDVVAGALIATNPAMGTVGMLCVNGALVPAATTKYLLLTATFYQIRPGLVSTIRAMGSEGFGGIITAGSVGTRTDCFVSVTRVGNLI